MATWQILPIAGNMWQAILDLPPIMAGSPPRAVPARVLGDSWFRSQAEAQAWTQSQRAMDAVLKAQANQRNEVARLNAAPASRSFSSMLVDVDAVLAQQRADEAAKMLREMELQEQAQREADARRAFQTAMRLPGLSWGAKAPPRTSSSAAELAVSEKAARAAKPGLSNERLVLIGVVGLAAVVGLGLMLRR